MLIRYSVDDTRGKRRYRQGALVYTLDEHGVRSEDIDSDAIRVIRKIRQAGYQAYVVGGAVRDLMAGICPKDFDIATDAYPGKLRKLFRHSRVIGRRFKLVHVYTSAEKYLEVSTFRSLDPEATGSEYGSISEDARRRDFTLNGLFYCPMKQQVIDYVGGVRDIRGRRMRTIAPARRSFREDPVRMLRVVKQAVQVGFTLPPLTRWTVRRIRHDLASCSSQRITEEVYKILRCAKSADVVLACYRLGLLEVILPSVHARLREKGRDPAGSGVIRALVGMDDEVRRRGGDRISTGRLLVSLLGSAVDEKETRVKEAMRVLRDEALPLIPSNRDLREAVRVLIPDAAEHNPASTRRGSSRRRRRRRPRPRRQQDQDSAGSSDGN